ncbi:hypothetical protein OVY01_14475 [Robbsia sp. Bb-Pol-6]|uniref:Uncharacterized protein n=1 Tax=Robbsia betulipollinis TaxID=2981849 RepID=A0ABT3ZR45_9BURK|nr:hypothetical protein [Robbsia betulipollinis]MCY0388415.1 hypothetical protein [Robbsia betulipollinis]
MPSGKTTKSLRADMPTVAAWIDQLRAAFGSDVIHDAIRAGEPAFYAEEDGHILGTPLLKNVNAWNLEGLAQRQFCKGCHGECVGTDQPCHR